MSHPLSQITIGSLFSGIGGLDLGLESCGIGPVLWQVEYDAFCRSILARHWPGAARAVHDVRLAGRSNLASVDLICGGFPCQPVSLAGGRKAQEDERWLWPEYARIVGELRPRFVFLENVPGLLSAGDGAAFGEVLGSLAALGYAAEWDVFRASDVGAPHRRERWFLLAYRDGEREPQPRRDERVERRRAFDGGQDGADGLAHARGIGYGAIAGGVSGDARRNGPRIDRVAPGVCGDGAGALADTMRGAPIGWQPQRVRGGAVPPGAGDGGEDRGAGGDGEPVGVGQADSNGARLEERLSFPGDAGAERPPALRGDADADAGAAESRVGRGPHGLSAGLDGAADRGEAAEHALPDRWPAGRGEAQHPWEAPRTAHKVTARPARLKALGNAVVPAQAALAWRVLWARMERTIAQEAQKIAREKSAQKPQKSLKSPRRKKAA